MRRLFRWAIALVRNTRDYLFEKPVRIGIVLLALVGGSVAGAPVGQEAFRYMWTDARFCDDCHTHDYANVAWAKSVHGKLTTCHDCHRVPIRHYPSNLWVTLTRKPETQADIHRPDVATVICEQCHSSSGAEETLTGPLPLALRKQVVKVDFSPLHKLHLESETREPGLYRGGGDVDDGKGEHDHGAAAADDEDGHDPAGGHGGEAHFNGPIGCMDCHGSEDNRAHQFQANRDNCLACHPDQQLVGDRLEMLSCRECHFAGFLGGHDDGDTPPPTAEAHP